ncbi:MAG: hypothetical protein NkDv07_0352 [Candidatus Improbicoccus devescovinae]|nr:MAG: hypothetical protein NkDv07_0352 [Candidatus Improbicoccus devescovinae]
MKKKFICAGLSVLLAMLPIFNANNHAKGMLGAVLPHDENENQNKQKSMSEALKGILLVSGVTLCMSGVIIGISDGIATSKQPLNPGKNRWEGPDNFNYAEYLSKPDYIHAETRIGLDKPNTSLRYYNTDSKTILRNTFKYILEKRFNHLNQVSDCIKKFIEKATNKEFIRELCNHRGHEYESQATPDLTLVNELYDSLFHLRVEIYSQPDKIPDVKFSPRLTHAIIQNILPRADENIHIIITDVYDNQKFNTPINTWQPHN